MSITPTGGWSNPSRNSEDGLGLADMVGSCPKCHSDDWKSAGLVYREGFSATSSRTNGTVVGIGRVGIRGGKFAVSGGAYRGRSSGVSQTALSRMATPPRMRIGIVILLAVLCVLLMFLAGGQLMSGRYPEAVLEWSVVGILMLALTGVYRRQRRAYDSAVSAYEDMRMCTRCGTFYSTASALETNETSRIDGHNRSAIILGYVTLGIVAVLAIAFRSKEGSDTESNTNSVLPSSRESDVFQWPTEGLPVYIANALSTQALSPSSPSENARELHLGVAGQRQFIPAVTSDDCMGSGGCVWTLVDGDTGHPLIESEQGVLHKTAKITNGYYDLLIEDKWELYIYEHRDQRYINTKCYERSNGLGSAARLASCQGDTAPSLTPKVSMGFPVSEETFVSAYVIANRGPENLSDEQLEQLAHDEYKMALGIDTQTLLLGGDVLNTRGKRAMDYLDELNRQQHQAQ
ncbi:MAG TPA: hypothetical protein VII58_07745 [Acidobacteriaceae bacterium]